LLSRWQGARVRSQAPDCASSALDAASHHGQLHGRARDGRRAERSDRHAASGGARSPRSGPRVERVEAIDPVHVNVDETRHDESVRQIMVRHAGAHRPPPHKSHDPSRRRCERGPGPGRDPADEVGAAEGDSHREGHSTGHGQSEMRVYLQADREGDVPVEAGTGHARQHPAQGTSRRRRQHDDPRGLARWKPAVIEVVVVERHQRRCSLTRQPEMLGSRMRVEGPRAPSRSRAPTQRLAMYPTSRREYWHPRRRADNRRLLETAPSSRERAHRLTVA